MSQKIIAFAGSNSSQSINRKLVTATLEALEGYETHLLDLNDFEMPLYSIDREKANGIPDLAHQFRQWMHQADGIVCSMAEHNRSYTVAFKNILDWCSRVDMNIFAGRPMLLMSTSPGGFGGGNVMAAAKGFFPACSAQIVETFSLPSFGKHFAEGQITDSALHAEWLGKIQLFREALATT
jgi:NAD(P)H-dependent FMN reductase